MQRFEHSMENDKYDQILIAKFGILFDLNLKLPMASSSWFGIKYPVWSTDRGNLAK